jgi:hypothetical protein
MRGSTGERNTAKRGVSYKRHSGYTEKVRVIAQAGKSQSLLPYLNGKGHIMKHGGMRWVLLVSVLLVSLLVACGPGETPDNSGTPESAGSEPEPVEKLVIDKPVFSPDGYYTFDNPGGWTIYQGLNLSDPEETVMVGVLVYAGETVPFEGFVKDWGGEEFEIQEAENGWSYVITEIAETPSIFVESADGVHWFYQIHKITDDADQESFVDTVVEIALSATYIPRETESESEE